MSARLLPALLTLAGLLAACASNPFQSDLAVADDIAAPAGLMARVRPAPAFLLTTRERIGKRGEDVTIYLEGDGAAWLNRSQPSLDPTPGNPVALKLAALDRAVNVAWIARPCQYTPMDRNPECRPFYWTNGRFAEAVVAAVDVAVDAVKREAGAPRVHLVGYSGGGGLAVLVAARRNDVASIRTVAGNLDHRAFTSHHGVSPMDASLNSADFATRVRRIPQTHYTGFEDRVVPPALARSYLQRFADARCVEIRIVAGASHGQGWTPWWETQAAQIPACRN